MIHKTKLQKDYRLCLLMLSTISFLVLNQKYDFIWKLDKSKLEALHHPARFPILQVSISPCGNKSVLRIYGMGVYSCCTLTGCREMRRTCEKSSGWGSQEHASAIPVIHCTTFISSCMAIGMGSSSVLLPGLYHGLRMGDKWWTLACIVPSL